MREIPQNYHTLTSLKLKASSHLKMDHWDDLFSGAKWLLVCREGNWLTRSTDSDICTILLIQKWWDFIQIKLYMNMIGDSLPHSLLRDSQK